jgi:acetyltransferase-like isoleucine patch superfamily enzyme
MTDYRARFKSCGTDVVVEDGVMIEHPEVMEVGDRVTFMRGLRWLDRTEIVRVGSDVTFYENCFLQGPAERFTVADHVDFYPMTYLSLGKGPTSFIDIGHTTHFAPGCVLYGWGGLTIGPHCNIAAHCVLATIGHDPVRRGDKPMAIPPYVSAPITLEEDIWLGANVTVTSGVTIAKGCMIGANAVVNRSTEPFGLYVGVPATRKRDRVEGETRRQGDTETRREE